MIDVETGTVVVPIEQLAGTYAQHAALKLASLGCWVVAIYPRGWLIKTKTGTKPASGKEPIGNSWGLYRANPVRLNDTYDEFPGAGVGICLGPGKAPNGGWLIDVEGDGPQAEASRAKLLGEHPPPTAGWASTRGGHGLMVVHDKARMLAIQAALGRSGVIKDKKGESNLPGLEIRVGGYFPTGRVIQLQSVTPPSIGTNGQAREWNAFDVIQPVPAQFYAFLEGLVAQKAAEKAAKEAAVVTAAANGHATGWDPALDIGDIAELENLRSWFTKKLHAQAADVRDAAEGSRHNTLLSRAHTLGGYLGNEIVGKYALLNEAAVVAALRAAGIKSGLDVDDVDATVAYGIGKGKEEPLPWPTSLDLPGVCTVDVDDDLCGGDDGDNNVGGDDQFGDGDDGDGDKPELAAAPHADAGAGNGEPTAPSPPKKLKTLSKATVAAAIATKARMAARPNRRCFSFTIPVKKHDPSAQGGQPA